MLRAHFAFTDKSGLIRVLAVLIIRYCPAMWRARFEVSHEKLAPWCAILLCRQLHACNTNYWITTSI